MFRPIYSFILAAAAVVLSQLFSFSLCARESSKLSLDGQWKFFYAADASTADKMVQEQKFYLPEFDSRGFNDIAVPSCWAILGYEEPSYRFFENDEGSEGLYLKSFTLPSEWQGKRLEVNFGGVWASAEIWLNGSWVGRHDSGYTSFSYDVSEYAKAGESNLLAVRVRQTYPGYKCDTYDDWSLGGIYRPVSITAMPAKRWIESVRVVSSFSEDYKKAEVSVRVMVADEHKTTLPGNYRSPGTPYRLKVSLLDKGGKEAASKILTVQGHTATARLTDVILPLEEPLLWSAETPNLYTLKVELLEKDSVSQLYTEKVGLREVSTSGGVLKINGVAVKLRGINRHDEHPDVGRATTKEHWQQDITMMKEANINYIRACHYQHAKGFIEMCDSLGMYVGAEISLGGADNLMYDKGFYGGMSTRVLETVERDLNNPSIIYWSVGNEDSFNSMFYAAAKMTKALDGTRPVLYPWNADETLPEDIDILAPHYWTAHEYDSLATSSTRPVITTEYIHAYGTERFGGLEDCWDALTKHPNGAGGAVWMWADQGVKTPNKVSNPKFGTLSDDEYLRISTDGWDGIVDSYRKPTRDYYELKAVYNPVKADSKEVSPDGSVVEISLRNGYDFTPLSDFSQRWSLYTDGRLRDSREEVVEAAPHEKGVLSVPLGKLGKLKSGETAYIKVSTLDKSGHEVGVNSVRLRLPSTAESTHKGKVQLSDKGGDEVRVTSQRNTFVFSRLTGSLERVSKGGKTVLEHLRPSVWHNLNEAEHSIRNKGTGSSVNLEEFNSQEVLSMEVKEAKGSVKVSSSVRYTAQGGNSVETEYEFTVLPGGKMEVNYTIKPNIPAANLLPLAGVSVGTATEGLKQWFGLGPEDAYPNKKTCPQLGLYDGRNAYGCKAVDWLEVGTLRITTEGYLVRDEDSPEVLRLAPTVLGRSEKGRLKDPRYHLAPQGAAFSGTLTME